jgi:peptidoglycan L-alanyl-D-glutamate endopeptidase CwlK
MPKFGKTSMKRLQTCHPDIARVLEQAIKNGPDFSILCGHRTQAEQDKVVADGMSKVAWPNSKHNSTPSMAVDIVPYPVDWNDTNRFRVLAGYVLGIADAMGISLRWGGDWSRDFSEKDERFRDMPHFELVENDA